MKHDDLVFDIGMYRGEDTAYYLAKGFRVLAVEANPDLVEANRTRFRDPIATGRLTIIGAAVADHSGGVDLAVWDEVNFLSSINTSFIAHNRRTWGEPTRTISVPTVRFADLLHEHGVPHYLKIDIEGSDVLCLRGLRDVSDRPDYLSVESAVSSPTDVRAVITELTALRRLGYRRFKFVDQAFHAMSFAGSGPFGEHTPGRWTPIGRTAVRAALLRLQYELAGDGGRWTRTVPGRGYYKLYKLAKRHAFAWYDLHAKLGS
jgi:FkbM family methyltransferase